MSPRKRPKQEIKKNFVTGKIDIPEKDNMGNFQIIMVICFFWASLQSLIYFQSLELQLLGFFKLYSLFLGLSFLIPISIYRRWLTISFYEYIILNVISISPAVIALIFMINSVFASASYKEEYRIVGATHTEIETTYLLENKAYEDKEHLRVVRIMDEVDVSGSEFFCIHFSDGLLGLRIVEKREIY